MNTILEPYIPYNVDMGTISFRRFADLDFGDMKLYCELKCNRIIHHGKFIDLAEPLDYEKEFDTWFSDVDLLDEEYVMIKKVFFCMLEDESNGLADISDRMVMQYCFFGDTIEENKKNKWYCGPLRPTYEEDMAKWKEENLKNNELNQDRID